MWYALRTNEVSALLSNANDTQLSSLCRYIIKVHIYTSIMTDITVETNRLIFLVYKTTKIYIEMEIDLYKERVREKDLYINTYMLIVSQTVANHGMVEQNRYKVIINASRLKI